MADFLVVVGGGLIVLVFIGLLAEVAEHVYNERKYRRNMRRRLLNLKARR